MPTTTLRAADDLSASGAHGARGSSSAPRDPLMTVDPDVSRLRTS